MTRSLRGITGALSSVLSRALLGALLVGGAAPAGVRAQGADAICGEWLTADGKAKVLVYRCDSLYCGKIVWLKEPTKEGKETVDDKNPDPKLRSQPVLGLVIMRDFEYDGEDEWKGGKVYDPESGDTYSGKMWLEENGTLKLRGYVLIPLFGRSEVWTRE